MSDLKPKIFIFSFIVLTILSVGFYLHFCIFHKNKYEQQEWFMYQDSFIKIQNNQNKIDTLFLGDSRLKSIVQVKNSELNLTLPNSGPIEAYFILKSYLKNNIKPIKIILSFAPYHLIRTRAFFNRSISYNFFNKAQLDQIFIKSKELHDTHFDSYHYYKTKYLPNTYYPKVKKYLLKNQPNNLQDFKSLLLKNKGQVFFGKQKGSSELNDEVFISKDPYSETILYYFKQLILLSKQHGIKVFYYSAPLNQSSCNVLPQSFFKNHKHYLSQLDINIVHNLECWPDQYFGDSSHLYLGAELANQSLRQQIASN